MITGPAFAAVLALFAFAACQQEVDQAIDHTAASSPAGTDEGLLYGRITIHNGSTYEGRLRWGGDEEALWGNYFNGFKDENPWVSHVPIEQLPKERLSIEIFGVEIAHWERSLELGRPFMARFGDIARIDPDGADMRVTLKSGTVFTLDRYAADDLADGLRVWDGTDGVVDLVEWRIQSVELLPSAPYRTAPNALHGTVVTRHGDFTGFLQWDREAALGGDELGGLGADGEFVSLSFEDIQSIGRRSSDSSLVTLLDGREMVLSDSRETGPGNRGIYVDDQRYGRVLVSWDAFEHVDFQPGGSGPAYGDFPTGGPITGSVTTRTGQHLEGRLVFDLDESETTETLDAPSHGVDYTIPFGLIASIVPHVEERGGQGAMVTLHAGEELQLERTGDLGETNAGMLVFLDGTSRPEYVPWNDVEVVRFDRPRQTLPPIGPR